MTDDILLEYATAAVRADEARANQGWRIMDDGRVFTRHNPDDAVRPTDDDVYWYSVPWPARPAKVIGPDRLARIREHIDHYAPEPEHHREEAAGREGGMWYRVDLHTREGRRVVEMDSPHRKQVDEVLQPVLDIMSEKGP